MQARRLFVALAAIAVFMAIGNPARAQSLPPVCLKLPNDFFTERTAFLDAEHRKLFDEARATDSKEPYERVQARVRDRLRKRIAAAGQTSVNGAILQVDLLRLIQHEDSVSADTKNAMRARIRSALAKAPPTPAAVEALAAFAGHLEDDKDENKKARAELMTLALARHRQAFGETPRQYVLWSGLFMQAADDGRLALARQIMAAGSKMNSPPMVFVAQMAVFRHLPPDAPERAQLARLIAEEAMRVVRAPRPEKDSEPACYPDMSAHTSDFTAALAIAGREQDRREFIKLAVQHVADSIQFGTHAQFVLQDISQIVAARAIDFEAYLTAMGRIEPANAQCSPPERPAVLCNIRSAAAIMLENNQPALGITMLRDAEQLLKRFAGGGEALAWEIKVALAGAEWRHGAKSAAAAAVAAMPAAQIERVAGPGTVITFHALKADIADALLDPQQAEASFSALVEAAVALANAPKPTARTADGQESDDEHPDLWSALNTVRPLVWRHLRRQFCAECGRPVAAAAVRWITAVRDMKRPEPKDAAQALLAHQILRKTVPALGDEQGYVNALRRSAPELWAPVIAHIRRRMQTKASELDAARMLALYTATAGSYGYNPLTGGGSELNANDRQVIDDFILFLQEKNPEKQSDIWEDRLGHNLNGDASGLDWFHDALESSAYLLNALGHDQAAEAILLFLVEDIERDDRDDKDGGASLVEYTKGRAAFWGSVYATIAGYDGRRGDYKEASKEIGRSQRIVTARLEQDWIASADRIGPLLRELRPTLGRLAVMRLLVATGADGDERHLDEAFEALQLAMLGETAAGMQASLRRRLSADPQLAAAMDARDRLRAQIDLAKAFDETVGVLDEGARKRELAELAQQLAGTERKVEQMLPAAETIGALRPLPRKEAQALLAPEEALLLLHSDERGVFAGVLGAVGEPQFWIAQLDRQDLERRILELRRGLDADGRLPDFPLARAHELFKLLLGPAETKLGQVKRLLVLVDGALVSLPLAVLPQQMPATAPASPADYRGARIEWLGLSHGIAYLPALRSLETRRAPRLASQARYAFAGIANPVLGDQASSVRRIDYSALFARRSLANADVLRSLAPLPETEGEVRAIAKALRGRDADLFIGPRATETDIRRNGLGAYRVIMFATHGAMGGELDATSEPGLVLTPPAKASPADDGLLTASEVAAMKLDADLVILSACNTAASDGRPRAEGFSGLTRAFLSAGARSVIATHWAIPSKPAVHVTTAMMGEHPGDQRAPWSESLRRAFVRMVEREGPPEYAHPANWAAFAVVGTEAASK